MNAEQEIRNAQQDWARSRGIPFNPSGYVREVEHNLWRPLSTRARQAFERGAGSELSGHMRALHSSSALVVNFFDYWACRDKGPLTSALGMDLEGGSSLDFEAQFPTGLGGTPPHLDVAITCGTGFVVAVEGKFTEHLKRSTTGKSRFTETYFPKPVGRWMGKGLCASQSLAEELWDEECRGGPKRFEYLDARQLLKHTLGLATQLGSRFSLLYLYYEQPGDGLEAHRCEIGMFERWVGAEINFKALTYQEVFERLRQSEQAGSEYLKYLETRYFTRMA